MFRPPLTTTSWSCTCGRENRSRHIATHEEPWRSNPTALYIRICCREFAVARTVRPGAKVDRLWQGAQHLQSRLCSAARSGETVFVSSAFLLELRLTVAPSWTGFFVSAGENRQVAARAGCHVFAGRRLDT